MQKLQKNLKKGKIVKNRPTQKLKKLWKNNSFYHKKVQEIMKITVNQCNFSSIV